MTTTICQACNTPTVVELLDAGHHPIANRFVRDTRSPEPLFPLVLGQCERCGLIQLTTLVPPRELLPRYDWITYNEPEGHLDATVALIAGLPGLTTASVVGALTYKDDSTLARLRHRGYERSWRIDAAADLGAPPCANIETVQDRLDPERARRIARQNGQADLLLARHILEHAHDTRRFAAAVSALVRPGGYVVFEVPDCTRVLDTLDYTTIWEEHVLYFTEPTYRRSIEELGFDVVRTDCHPYPYENSLVAVAVNARPTSSCGVAEVDVTAERDRARRFATTFDARRRAVKTALHERCSRGRRTAIFGAGHLSCMFINVNGVAGQIAFVVDDHPGKRGLLMPGSHVPVRESQALLTEDIDLCLSSLSPESEEKVVARQAEFIRRGGVFRSIFPASRRAMDCGPFEGGRSGC